MRGPLLPVLICLSIPAAAYAPRADLDAGRYLKALAEAEVQIAANPANALAWAAKSQALTALVRLPEALKAADRSLELQPGLADGLLARALARAGIAVQKKNLGSLGGISDSMDDLRAAVKADPGLGAAWMALGLGYQQLPGILGGSTRRALDCAESLKRVAPARGAALQGTIHALDKNWGRASASFGLALTLAPKDPEVIYAYLDALGSRETRKAIGDGEQKRLLALEARRLQPAAAGRARALAAVCDAFLDAGLPEEAWTTALQALGTVDAPSVLRLELGKISARSGVHAAEGLAFLDQVLREPLEGGTGGHGSAHWRRGQVLKGLGRPQEARQAALAALALDPKDSKAKKLLEELGR